MISSYVGTSLDRRQFAGTCKPAARVTLYSRNLDSDSDIVNGTQKGVAMDITAYVESGELLLSAETRASTLTLEVVLGGRLSLGMFFNAVVTLHEGYLEEDPTSWPQTFWGYHVGAPQSTETATGSLVSDADSYTRRGQARKATITFVSRAKNFSTVEITSPGVWLPRGPNKNPDPLYSHRDAFDDLGSIVRDIATSEWGMGLRGGEVNIGKLPYRIEKQLQVVQDNVLDAIATVLEPLHLVPTFDGRGALTYYSLDPRKTPVRTYDRTFVVEMPQPARSQAVTNAVEMSGLASQTSRILHADQRLLEVRGTFGFFDSSVTTRGTWGDDETESFRVVVGAVTDPNGKSVMSPRFENVELSGFIIEPISGPDFDYVDEYRYVITIRNNVFLVVGALALLIAGYLGAVLATTLFPEVSAPPGSPDVVNPGAIAAEIAASALLIAGITVLQQIGNFRFEVHGVPFEEVYRELTHQEMLAYFAAFDATGGTVQRCWERRLEKYENHILSSYEDRLLDDGTTNVGIISWAKQQLAIEVAKGAPRSLRTARDILLEPGDVVAVGNQAIFVQTVSRRIRRGSDEPQTLSGYQIRTL